MRLLQSLLPAALLLASEAAATPFSMFRRGYDKKIAPRLVIISMFTPEATIWWDIKEFDLTAQNITVPGLSPRFPLAHCTKDGYVCQIIVGEGEINAATSVQALWQSDFFDLSESYFLIAGIAGINPNQGSLGDVTLQRFAVQVNLQYEIDTRELGSNYSTSYIPYGAQLPAPLQYPGNFYGTEVFELNVALRDKAYALASTAKLNDSDAAVAYRALYTQAAAKQSPQVRKCDGATSDQWYSGEILGSGADAYMSLVTNGSTTYCTTASEDTASLEALMRGALAKKLDFGRIILLRTAVNFDRQHAGISVQQYKWVDNSGGFLPGLRNIYLGGIPIVKEIVFENWKDYRKGVKASNYIGDVFGSLGGVPDFGPYPYFAEA